VWYCLRFGMWRLYAGPTEMTDTALAFNPEMLTLARESRGLSITDLAKAASVSKSMLSRIEGGLRQPSVTMLARLADALGYPESFFRQRVYIYGVEPAQLFHRKRSRVALSALTEIYARIHIVQLNLPKLLRSVELPELRIRPFDIEEYDGTEEDIARAVRLSWGLGRGPLRDLTRAIEGAGGLVIPFDFGTEHIDAISLWPVGLPPLFFVDMNKPSDRLRFSLCHELAHVVMHRQYLEPDMEKQANKFAGEFLVPGRDVVFDDFSLGSIAAMKPYWRVSMGVLIKRASALGLIGDRYERTLWSKMTAAGYHKREPKELDIPREEPTLYPGIIDLHRKELGYTKAELAELLLLNEADVQALYLSLVQEKEHPHLRLIV